MKNKPNLDLYPFNKKVSLDLLCEKTFQEKKERENICTGMESLNLFTWEKSFMKDEFPADHKTQENRMSLSVV